VDVDGCVHILDYGALQWLDEPRTAPVTTPTYLPSEEAAAMARMLRQLHALRSKAMEDIALGRLTLQQADAVLLEQQRQVVAARSHQHIGTHTDVQLLGLSLAGLLGGRMTPGQMICPGHAVTALPFFDACAVPIVGLTNSEAFGRLPAYVKAFVVVCACTQSSLRPSAEEAAALWVLAAHGEAAKDEQVGAEAAVADQALSIAQSALEAALQSSPNDEGMGGLFAAVQLAQAQAEGAAEEALRQEACRQSLREFVAGPEAAALLARAVQVAPALLKRAEEAGGRAVEAADGMLAYAGHHRPGASAEAQQVKQEAESFLQAFRLLACAAQQVQQGGLAPGVATSATSALGELSLTALPGILAPQPAASEAAVPSTVGTPTTPAVGVMPLAAGLLELEATEAAAGGEAPERAAGEAPAVAGGEATERAFPRRRGFWRRAAGRTMRVVGVLGLVVGATLVRPKRGS